MALSAALVDRGRAITFERLMRHLPDGTVQPIRIEGEDQFEWTYGPYFDCRLDSPAAPKVTDAAGGRDRAASKPTLMFALEDDFDNPVELHDDDRVEVESDEFGTLTFRLTGEPVIYRKKIDLVCGEAALSRLLDPPVVTGRVAQIVDNTTAVVTIASGGS